jgi:Fe2+ transport system protein B
MLKQNSNETKELLASFMKKQASVKLAAKSSASLSIESVRDKKNNKEKDKNQEGQEEKEKLEEAKKNSRSKAAQYDQTQMIKKLLIEKSAKYILLIAILVILAISLIKFGPAVLDFFDGLIFKVLMKALHHQNLS